MSEILVVASKVKQYIKVKGDLNCSGAVMEKLSEIIKAECDRAIHNAKKDKRKTLMDRDFFED